MPCSGQDATCPEPVEWVPILDELRMREEQKSQTISDHPCPSVANRGGEAVETQDNLRSSAGNLRPSALNKGRGWGGRRPGAGAPKGNLNAMKHGRTSRRQAQLVEALMQVPEAATT
jgi:hypothetical protein